MAALDANVIAMERMIESLTRSKMEAAATSHTLQQLHPNNRSVVPHRDRHRRARVLPLLLIFSAKKCFAVLSLALAFFFAGMLGNTSHAAEDSSEGVQLSSVRSGLNGVWKIGHETQHQLELKNAPPTDVIVELETVDGDGVRVLYQAFVEASELAGKSSATVTLHAKHGRMDHPITIRIRDRGKDRLLIEHVLTDEERGLTLTSDQPWVVGIGSPEMKLDTAVLRSARSAVGDYHVVELTDASQIPDRFRGFDGVDLLVFSSSNPELIASLSQDQGTAIRDWIWYGGRTLFTLGEHAETWFAREEFAGLVPGELKSIAKSCNPAPLEAFLNSEVPLQRFSSAILQLPGNAPELIGQQSDRTPYPLIARWTAGLGRVRWLAMEIDSPELKSWQGQTAFIKHIMNDQWEGRGPQARSLVSAEDLSLQLNDALNRFDGVRTGNLTQMSMLLFLLLAILGPFDYFIVAKRWKSPRLTWLTLGGAVALSCGALIYLQKAWKPATPLLNSIEIVDIDAGSGEMIGRSFTHLYGGSRGEYALSAHPAELVLNPSGASSPSSTEPTASHEGKPTTSARTEVHLDWLGQPGKGLGGFDSSVATDRIIPPYAIVRSTASRLEGGGSSELETPTYGIANLGIPEAGTKGLACTWRSRIADGGNFGELSSLPGAIDLLNGHITNPLSLDLVNAVLVYRGRFYSLPLRIKPGDKAQFSVSVVPKDFTRRLQRRVNIDGKDAGTPWNRNDSDLNRIAEILSFHRSSGGSSYTGMIHRYLSKLDQSEILKTERAILYAEVAEPQLQWNVERKGAELPPLDGTRNTIFRILIPVNPPN